MAAVGHTVKRTAVTKKELWIQGMVERRGKKCAAVALANKTVKTSICDAYTRHRVQSGITLRLIKSLNNKNAYLKMKISVLNQFVT